jgi:DNA mismatch repair protein MutL
MLFPGAGETMGQIITLDQNMINMIAAGEVIERPASVVKELMENSIDADATKITVAIEDGGRKLISVADNGCGMDAEDLALAFESHTTSKIKSSTDLQGISTLGFRGEALASIASVAQVRAVSRTKDSLCAYGIEIDCGDKGDTLPSSGDYGTTIHIRDLFYKMPARRKFLKTANTEIGHIIEQFIRIALANAFVADAVKLDMTLMHNGKELYRLAARQTLHQRIADLFSSEIADNLIETESSEKGLHIFALLGKPDISRTNNNLQYIFLNGRFIRDKFISHATKEAYHGILEPNRFPVVFLSVHIPYSEVDVNVHPTKVEVRFYNANLVHSQVLGCIREKLLSSNLETGGKLPASKSIAEEQITATASPYGRSQKIADAMAEFFQKYRPVQTQQRFGFPAEGFSEKSQTTYEVAAGYPAHSMQDGKKFLQIHDSFIVAETDDGFVIIDQHALHERIVYEDLLRRISAGKLESQKLLIPEILEMSDAQADVVKANAELIEKLGIELVPFGCQRYAVQGFPSIIANVGPLEFIRDMIDLLDNKDINGDSEKLLDEILNMAACKAAIKAGQKLSDREIEQLLADKGAAEYAARCPHGRPTTIKFTLSQLEKQFKRT